MNQIEKQEKFRAYVQSAGDEPFVWGVNDCTMWAARWANLISPTRIEIPAYADEAEALRRIEEAGSLEALWSEALASQGIHETFNPGCGDVAVIDHKVGQIGAILAHHGLAYIRFHSGATVLRPRKIIKAWAL